MTNAHGRWKKSAGFSLVNHEVAYVAQMLRTAGLWAPLAKLYTPIPSEGFKKPKVMDDVEKRRFFTTAASRPEWSLALWVATITANTSASGSELRNLQLADLMLDDNPRIIINAATAKCRQRGRSIELNGPALEAVLKCLDRAKELGSIRPEHYLFPKLNKYTRKWEPTHPASDSWLRRSWGSLREASGVPWITPHCLRHQCITELGEKGVAPEVIRQIAGHVSEEMMRHYTHARRDQQASALKLLEPSAARPTRKAASPAGRTTPQPAFISSSLFGTLSLASSITSTAFGR